MFESFVPDSGTSLDSSLNPSLTGLTGNLEPMDSITPQCAVKKLTPGGSSPELLDTTLRSPGSDDSSILLPKSFLSQSLDAPTTNSSSVDPLTGIGSEVPEVVEQAVQLTYDALTGFAISSDFSNKMNQAFGDSFDTKVADAIANQFAQGDFSDIPEIEILSAATMNGANGAFSEATNKIYLSRDFVASNAGNMDAIANVLLEETGHYIDSKINVKDAAGDEGDIFSRLVQGQTLDFGQLLALKAEDDTAIINLEGKDVLIEQSRPSDFGINLSSVHYSRSGNKFVASNGTGGTYLWCTDFAFGRALEKGLIQNYSGLGGRISGHAGVWDDQAGTWGRQAQANSFIVWDPNQGGAGSVGHVGFVERINSDGSFVISEANFASAQMSFNSRTIFPGTSAFNTAKFVYLSGATPNPGGTSSFRGIVDAPVNIRSGPGTNFSIVGSLSTGNSRTFDSVARGTSHYDSREQRDDNRWFRIQGTNNWVSGAFITGNPLFNGSVDASVNVRSGPGTNFSIVGSLSTGNSQTFDATTVGTTHWDTREGRNENRWFRIQNTDRWVSAAFITGNPTY